MPEEYELIPTSKQRGSFRPQGWVQLAPGMNPKRRTMTEGHLNQRMPRGNTVAINQNYVMKVLNNPKTLGRIARASSPLHPGPSRQVHAAS